MPDIEAKLPGGYITREKMDSMSETLDIEKHDDLDYYYVHFGNVPKGFVKFFREKNTIENDLEYIVTEGNTQDLFTLLIMFKEEIQPEDESKFKSLIVQAEFLFQFSSFTDWKNNASHRFKSYSLTHKTVCIDANGDVCHIGEDFMQARDKKLFPVKVYSLQRTKH